MNLFSSCQKHEWNNPFDKSTNPETFSPINFSGSYKSNSVELNWSLSNPNISRFIITRTAPNGSKVEFALLNNQTNLIDKSVEDGINYTYSISAIAGFNTSSLKSISISIPQNPIRIGIKSGLQVFYSFTGNPNDASGKDYNGIASGVTLTNDRFNEPNTAYLFKGASKIVTSYFGIAGYNSRTISLWFKIAPNTIGNHSHILSYGGNPFVNENMFSIFVSGLGSPKPYIGLLSNGYVGTRFNNLQDNQWHHLALIVDNINLGKLTSTKMYLDGIYFTYDVFYYSSDINTKINLPLTIGQFTSLDTDPRNFGGSLDDIGIWNRVLSETEIKYLYQNNYKP